MSLPRRARTIVIDGDRYRWLITEPASWIENASAWEDVLAARRLTLVVQRASGRGQKLLAWVPVYRTPILRADVAVPQDNGVVFLQTPHQETAVSPALVRRVVTYALRSGWTPSEPASDFVVAAEVLRTLLQDSA